MRRLGAIAAVAVAAAALPGCAPVPTQPGFKPLIVGLVDKGDASPYLANQPFPVLDLSRDASASPGLAGTVVNVSWSQLEPNQGTFDFSTLDASLAAVSAYNAAHPSATLAVKLRVFGGYGAPQWAKTLDGGSISISVHGSVQGTVGQWWKPDYRAAWAALQSALAARYDTNPLVREVAVASCSTISAEPFVTSPAPSNVTQMLADGWTNAASQACLDGALADYAPWRHTAVYFPFNGFTTITPAGKTGVDYNVTDEVMQRCVSSVGSGGAWCILGNNALSSASTLPAGASVIGSMIDKYYAANPNTTPIAFQQFSANPSAQCGTVSAAIGHHAQSLELWPNGIATQTPATLSSWGQDFTTGAAPTCSS